MMMFAVVILIGVLIGGFCWPYAINHWLDYFGKTAHVAFWQGALLGLVPGIGHFGIVAAVLTWIVALFIG